MILEIVGTSMNKGIGTKKLYFFIPIPLFVSSPISKKNKLIITSNKYTKITDI